MELRSRRAVLPDGVLAAGTVALGACSSVTGSRSAPTTTTPPTTAPPATPDGATTDGVLTLFSDGGINFEQLFSVAAAGYGASDLGEAITAASTAGYGATDQQVVDTFQAMSDTVAGDAAQAAAAGRTITARDRYLRAAEYLTGPLYFVLGTDTPRPGARRLIALGARRIDIGQGDVSWVVMADPEGNEFCVVLRSEFLATTGLIGAIVFEPADYPAVGRFWSEATGWPVVYDQDGDIAIRDPSGRGPFMAFGPPVHRAKTAKNRLHLDIAPPLDGDQEAEVERLRALGARRIDIGQGDVSWLVMADPEGNEFCVLSPR